MVDRIVLASGSGIRATLLRNAGLSFDVDTPRVDEEAIRDAMVAEDAPARDVADTLADAKAAKVAGRHPDAVVIGCDQVLDHRGRILSKPRTPDDAVAQLRELSGERHMLLSAVVAYADGRPVWRHVGDVRMAMRPLSDGYIKEYVTRNWDSIRGSVGSYKLEEEGARLFTEVRGDYFTVLGLPLLDLLSYLVLRGTLSA